MTWPLKAGDQLISLASKPEDEFKNQAVLIHTLRGKSGEVKVLVERDKKRMTLSLGNRPLERLTERVGLHFSGVVISYRKFKDNEEMNPYNFPMIEDVDDASLGDSAGMYYNTLIISVDGKPTPPLRSLCNCLREAEEKKKKVKFMSIGHYSSYRSQTSYYAHEVRITDVRRVGPQVKKGC